MKKIFLFIQFFPLTLFLGIARHYGFSNEAWPMAFQWGAAAAILELGILLPILKNRINQFITAVNLFLIFGGLGFFFQVTFLIEAVDFFRAAGVIFCIGVVSLFATLLGKTGVFEVAKPSGREQQFSYYFLLISSIAFIWSFYFKDSPLIGGAVPFIFLLVLKATLRRKLLTE